MVKKLILFLLGLIPFGLSFLMHSWSMKDQNSVLPLKLIGFMFLIFWILMGVKTCKIEETPLKSAIIINFTAFLVPLLLMYQEIILGHYWSNIFGVATQFYYLPILNLSFSFTFWTHYVWVAYIAGFLLMFTSYYLGIYLKTRSTL